MVWRRDLLSCAPGLGLVRRPEGEETFCGCYTGGAVSQSASGAEMCTVSR